MEKSYIKTTNPDAAFAALHSEHEDGMGFVSKLRNGLEMDLSVDKLKNYVFWFWQHHIKPHFRHEEDILLPFFPPGNKLALQLRNEHDMIREMILCLDDDADLRTIVLFADLITDHIAFEEQEVFPWMEKELTNEQLETIQKKLKEKPIHAPKDNGPGL